MAETGMEKKLPLGQWLLWRIKNARTVRDLEEVGGFILHLKIKDKNQELVLAWQEMWKSISPGGIHDQIEKEFYERVLHDLCQQEESARSTAQARAVDFFKATAELEKLIRGS